MIELKGTEKQVKWAEDIRLKLNDIIEIVKESTIERKTKKGKSYEDAILKIDNIKDIINNKNDAKYFIDYFKEITKMDNKEALLFINKLLIDSETLEDIRGINVFITFTIKNMH